MSKLYSFLSIVLISILVISCEEDNSSEPEDSTQEISGTITDSFDEPLSNLFIEAYIETTSNEKAKPNKLQAIEIIASDTTDNEGNFSLKDLPEDLTGIMLRLDNSDFVPLMLNSIIKDNDSYKIKFQRREDCDININFEINDEKGAAIDEAKIELKRESKVIRKSITNQEGMAELKEICPDNYELRITKNGYKVIEDKLEINENNTYAFVLAIKEDTDEKDSCCESSLGITIKDENGNPIDGIKVLVKKEGKAIDDPRTDGDGKIEVDNLCEGTYKIIATKDGYKGLEYEIEIGCDEEVNQSKTLLENEDGCCEGMAEILVQDKDGNSLADAYVIIKKAGKEIRTKITETDGMVKFDSLCEGEYALVIEREGYKRIDWETKVNCDEIYMVTKKLEDAVEECCNSSVEFKVKDSDGNPVKNSDIKIWKKGEVIKEIKTNGDGIAKLEEWCKGVYGVDISHSDFANIEFEFEIGCEEEKVFEKTLVNSDCCEGILRAVLNDEEGNGLEGVKVLLIKDGKAIEDPRTNGDGKATIDGLCEGNYVIVLSKEGFDTIEKEVNINCEEATELNLTLIGSDEECCDSSVELKIKDSDGNPVKNSEIRIWKKGEVVKETKTNDDGIAKLEEWCKGIYGVDISHPDFANIEFEFEIGCEEEKVFEKTLINDDCCEAIIKTKVIDKLTEIKLGGATVKYILDGKVVAEGVTNSDGYFIDDNLCKGNYTIEISKDGYDTKSFEWEIKECDSYQETFRL